MASAPQAAQLPLFYKDLMPLNSRDHAEWQSKTTENATWMVGQHAVPLTAEEFPEASRHYPIIFSSGENSVPLALMGLNEGVNVFLDAEGKLGDHTKVGLDYRNLPNDVRPGDTLIRIGLETGQNWRDIQNWNALANPNLIEVGQVLRVTPPAATTAESACVELPCSVSAASSAW